MPTWSFHLRQEAHQWYQWLTKTVRNHEHWTIFKEEIQVRFALVEFKRPCGVISNLKQQSTMLACLNKSGQLQGLCDSLLNQFLLEKFIDGLKEEIRFDVIALNPIDF